QSRSFTYVSDAVAATIAAMERAPAGAIYNVGGGEEATMREAIATLERISGRRLDLRAGPPAAGDVRRTSADVSRIRADLGWAPKPDYPGTQYLYVTGTASDIPGLIKAEWEAGLLAASLADSGLTDV